MALDDLDAPPVTLWLLSWEGAVDDGLEVLTTLGMGHEDARRALAQTPSVLGRDLRRATAHELVRRLEALGGRCELRDARPRAPAPTVDVPAVTPPTPPVPWPRRKGLNVFAGVALCVMLYFGLDTARVVGGSRRSSTTSPRATTALEQGIRQEAQNHLDDPEFARIFAELERGDESGATQSHFRGLQYLSHPELVRFFTLMRRVMATGCAAGAIDAELLSDDEFVEMGRLQAKSMALGASARPVTSGHERSMEEGVRFAYRRLPAREQPAFEALAARAGQEDARAECEFSVALLEASDAMPPDLQRRFLRAFAHRMGVLRGAI